MMNDVCSYLSTLILMLIIYSLMKLLFNKKKTLPGPWSWPIIGYYYNLGDNPQITLSNLAKQYGDVYQIHIGQLKAVILNGYSANKEALNEFGSDFAGRPSIYTLNWLVKEGGDYFGEYTKTFKHSRKITVKALAAMATIKNKAFEKIIQDGLTTFMETFQHSENQLFDPTNAIIRMAGYTTFKVLYGKHAPDIDDPEVNKMMIIASTFEADMDETAFLDSFPWLKYIYRNQIYNWQDFYIKLKQFVSKQIEKQKKDSEDSQNAVNVFLEANKTSNDELSMDVMTGDLAVLTEAGVGTTTPTLLWAFLLFACHPDIQFDLQKNLDDNLGSNKFVTWDYFNKLPFLEACILEIHRFASILPLNAMRSTMNNVNFRGYFIPKGSAVISNIWSIHRDESVWTTPSVFDPYRFLIPGENIIDNNLASKVMAFSSGRRRCPAEAMSRLILFPIIGTILLNFSLDCDVESKETFSIFPFKGIARPRLFKLKVKVRK